MKTINLFSITTIIFLAVACGESSESAEEVTEQIENTSDEVIDEIESELEPAIIQDLENEEFASKMSEVKGILIDVRTPEEYNEGHIEGAINLDNNSGAFESYLDSLDLTSPVFVYCHAGGRSGKARDILKDRNFLEVYNLKNGYGNWDK